MSPIFEVSDAVAVLNQTLDYAYPTLTVVGEVSEFRISKGKWLYFDIKDDQSKLKCFGTVYTMKMPLEDGMRIELVAQPRLHNLYGFSLNVVAVRPVGEGSIKKAKDALYEKLEKEGLFAPERKRAISYPPTKIGLIASEQSAAFADFMKIMSVRWPLVEIELYDVQVQGSQAEDDVVQALAQVNVNSSQPDVVVLIRGGGSADDLAVFSLESVTRAVATSRIPTLVAIGHEVDVSLSELASDLRASTPSNAAELLVPDKKEVAVQLAQAGRFVKKYVEEQLLREREQLQRTKEILYESSERFIVRQRSELSHAVLRIKSYHPHQVLKRGYALVRSSGKLVRDGSFIRSGDIVEIEFERVRASAHIDGIQKKEEESK